MRAFIAGVAALGLLYVGGKAYWSQRPAFQGKDQVNLLVIGTDQARNGRSRSDTLIFVVVDRPRNRLLAVWLPRDSRVRVKGALNKVNAAMSYGGKDLAIQTVKDNFNVAIDFYAVISTSAFREIVDLVGGVPVLIEKTMQYRDSAQGLVIDLHPSPEPQLLNGAQAEGFVRYRSDGRGDIGRVQRQMAFAKAFAKRCLEPANLPKLPGVAQKMQDAVETNLTLRDRLALASLSRRGTVETAMLPGHAQTLHGVSYWIVSDFGGLKKAVQGDWPPPSVVKALPIVVLNGNGQNGAARTAARKLRQGGLSWVSTGNAGRRDLQHTVIQTPDRSSLEQGRQVARALGCGRVQAAGEDTSPGSDHRPSGKRLPALSD